jgi:hypothetical protein
VGIHPKGLAAAPALAVAVARVAKLSLDAMIAGRLTEAGVCIACGGKKASPLEVTP